MSLLVDLARAKTEEDVKDAYFMLAEGIFAKVFDNTDRPRQSRFMIDPILGADDEHGGGLIHAFLD